MRAFTAAMTITIAAGLAVPALAVEQIKLDPFTYAQLGGTGIDDQPPALSVAMDDGRRVDLTFRPIEVWADGARIDLHRDGEIVASLQPAARRVWVAGTTIAGADGEPEAVSAVVRANALGGVSMSLRRSERELRWRSGGDTPRDLVPVDPPPVKPDPGDDGPTDGNPGGDDPSGEDGDGARDPVDGVDVGQTVRGQTADEGDGVTDRIRFGHLGAEIAVVVDAPGAEMIFQHDFAGRTSDPYTHVEAWVTDLFAHLNKPYRRDVELSLAISNLDIYLGHEEPWGSWIPALNRARSGLEQYTQADRRDVGVAWLALQNHWTSNRARVDRDAVLLLYGPPEAGDGGGYAKIGSVCDPTWAYAVVKISPSLLGFPTLPVGQSSSSSDFDATYFNTAHELGHIVGGEHTHPEFDRCDKESRKQIEQSTIMSYCKTRLDEFRLENRRRIRDVVERAACLDMLPYPPLESLVPGVPVHGIDVEKSFSRRFTLTVPPSTHTLELRTTGGQGDVQMYVMHNNVEVGRSMAPGTRQQVLIDSRC